jgi:hypothetical protein
LAPVVKLVGTVAPPDWSKSDEPLKSEYPAM